MIELNKAIAKGKEFLNEVYMQPDEIILDSAQKAEDSWMIKFRIPLSVKPINNLQNVLGINRRIYYKTVKIDESGNVIAVFDDDKIAQNQLSDVESHTA